MIMNRAEDIFQQIETGGFEAINGFILSRQSEELFLDFKRSSDCGKGNRLSQNDRNNLAKAISGFGNSEGGVLVWGVDCSQDPQEGDVARALVPIEKVYRFKSWIEGAISGCTVPPHSQVQNIAVVDESGANGFLITLIPKSINAPHQMIPNKQYYIRAGSDFVPTPHDVLSGLFGRRPQPHVFQMFTTAPANIENNKVKVNVGFIIRNQGPGIASNVFITLMLYRVPGPDGSIGFQPSDPQNWSGSWSFGRHLSLIAKDGIRLPPTAHCQPVIMEAFIEPPFDEGFRLEGTVGSAESEPHSFSLECSPEKISFLYKNLLTKASNRTLTKKDRHNFVYEFLNLDKEEITETRQVAPADASHR